MNQIKTTLILGGSGLLGAHCTSILSSSYKVVPTYNSHNLTIENSIYLNVLSNINILKDILLKFRPEVIINTIALVTVDGCETNPQLAKKLNVTFVTKLVNIINECKLIDSHLVHISSDSVYGFRQQYDNHSWLETDNLSPLSIYASTKRDSETEALKHLGPVSILRTAFYGLNSYSKTNLLWWIIDNARKKREIDGWDNVFFSPISASKLAYVIQMMIEKDVTGIYNVGSLNACNKFDFVDAVCELTNLQTKVNRISSEESLINTIRPKDSTLNSKKLSKIIPLNFTWYDDLENYLNSSTLFSLE